MFTKTASDLIYIVQVMDISVVLLKILRPMMSLSFFRRGFVCFSQVPKGVYFYLLLLKTSEFSGPLGESKPCCRLIINSLTFGLPIAG